MNGEPFYIFHREDAHGGKKTWAAEPGGLLTPPTGNTGLFTRPLDAYNMIWLIGPPRSGTAFHAHTEAWTALAHGRKRWLFYPPTSSPPAGGSGPDTYPTFAITHWWDQVRPLLPHGARPIECVQEPGDLMWVDTLTKILTCRCLAVFFAVVTSNCQPPVCASSRFCRYVPEGWHHAVINVDDVVGISFQNTSCKGPALPTLQCDCRAPSALVFSSCTVTTAANRIVLVLTVAIGMMPVVDSGGNFATVLHDALCRENSCDGDRWQQYSPAQKDAVLAGRREAVAMAEQQPYTHHALGEALLFGNNANNGGLEEAVQSYALAPANCARLSVCRLVKPRSRCVDSTWLLPCCCSYSKALEIDPLLGASAVGLARTYFVMQQQRKAEELLRNIIDAAPLNVRTLITSGRTIS